MKQKYGACHFGEFVYLNSPSDVAILKEVCNVKNKNIMFDIETSGLDPFIDVIYLISFSIDGKTAYVLNPSIVNPYYLIQMISDPSNTITGHNIKFDYKFINVKYNIKPIIKHDTYIMHALCCAGIGLFVGGNKLSNLCEKYLGTIVDKSIRNEFIEGRWDTPEQIKYSAGDVLCLSKLISKLEDMLRICKQDNTYYKYELPLIKVLADMEIRGIDMNINSCLQLRDEVIGRLNELDSELSDYANINWKSSKQLIDFFESNYVNVPEVQRKNGTISKSVGKNSLLHIEHDVISVLQEYSALNKQLNSFLLPWSCTPEEYPKGKLNLITNRIHTNFNQVNTDTGRLSSDEPNLQQVPKENKFRNLFFAPKDYMFVIEDFSQFELRVMAELSLDKEMLRLFKQREKKVLDLENKLYNINEVAYTPEIGDMYPEIRDISNEISNHYDMHAQTAITLFRLDRNKIDFESKEWKQIRKIAKTLAFGIPYGSGPAKIGETAGLTLEEAKKELANYFNIFPGIRNYINKVKLSCLEPMEESLKQDFLLTQDMGFSQSIGGRRRFYVLPEPTDIDYRKYKAAIQRQAVNQTIQSVNSDTIKLAMIRLYDELPKYNAYQLLSIHDEIITCCPKDKVKEVAMLQKDIMKSSASTFLKKTPVEVSITITDRWES